MISTPCTISFTSSTWVLGGPAGALLMGAWAGVVTANKSMSAMKATRKKGLVRIWSLQENKSNGMWAGLPQAERMYTANSIAPARSGQGNDGMRLGDDPDFPPVIVVFLYVNHS